MSENQTVSRTLATSCFTFILLSTISCASIKKVIPKDQVNCAQLDWYGIGEHDGSQGLAPDQFRKNLEKCDSVPPESETMYMNGRNAGLVEYCTTENAYELGRMSVTYLYVCPSTVEPDFLTAYRKGQKTLELETKDEELGVKIDQLYTKLSEIEDDEPEKRELSQELMNLRKERLAVTRQLQKTSRQ